VTPAEKAYREAQARWEAFNTLFCCMVLEALQGPPPDGGLWTGPKLRDWVERELGKRLSLYPIYRLLHEMGFALRVPRPRHRKADGEAQEAFKKTSSPRSRRQGPRGGG
jgi:transposase